MSEEDKFETKDHGNGLYSITKMNGVDIPEGVIVGFGEFHHDRYPLSPQAIATITAMYRDADEMRERCLQSSWDREVTEAEELAKEQETTKPAKISLWRALWKRFVG